jgi:small subunit ribosomal protein S1
MHHNSLQPDSEFPESPPDEQWWDSLLADEEKNSNDVEYPPASAAPSNPSERTDWNYLEKIYHNDSIISLEVTGYNRGGVLVQGENIQGFVPVSHLVNIATVTDEEERKQLLLEYVGQVLNLKIIEFVPEEERVVFSERAAQAGEGKRKLIFSQVKPGDTVSGTVTNVTDFGVFVDLGGLEGLIHVSELSWGRVEHPSDVLSVGRKIDALVLNISEQSSRIALSYKRLEKNPWETVIHNYYPGIIVSARITGLKKFGAFARLDEGIEGLIHISTMHFPDGVRDISQYLHVNDVVSVKILHIDPEKKRIGLCLENG